MDLSQPVLCGTSYESSSVCFCRDCKCIIYTFVPWDCLCSFYNLILVRPLMNLLHSVFHLNLFTLCSLLRRKSICTDLDTAYATASSISFKGAHNWHITAYIACVFSCVYIPSTVHFPSSSVDLPTVHVSSSHFLSYVYVFPNIGNFVWCVAVIIRTFVTESNIFSDQFYELLCFFLHGFADLRHG